MRTRVSGGRGRRARLSAAALALLLVLVSAPVAGAHASAAPEGAGLQGASYVALGDSYAAGYGIAPASGQPVPGCGQSETDYPRLVAAKLGLRLSDETCAGALTANLISTPQVTGAGTAPPQSTALGPATKIVTVTIGGNDLGFSSIASSCVALSASGPIVSDPQLASCRAAYVARGDNSLASRIDGPVLYGQPGAPSGIVAVFRTIRRDAPHARVFVVGYPAIVPDAARTPSSGCFRPAVSGLSTRGPYPQNSFPFTDTDVAYLSSVQQMLDASTRRAARSEGFHYVSLLAQTEAHSACAVAGAAYVNGISIDSISRGLAVTVEPGALHPNGAGVAFIAHAVESAVVRAVSSPSRPATPSPAPDPRRSSGFPAILPVVMGGAVLVALLAILAALVVGRRRGSRSSAR